MKSIISDITQFMFIDSPKIPEVDVALVLGHHEPKVMDQVLPFYADKRVKKIIISGYASLPERPPEAVCFASRGEEIGIRREDMILGTTATNTKENFNEFLELLKENFELSKIRRILLVTKAFHMRRTLMTAKHVLPSHFDYYLLSAVDELGVTPNNWWQEEKTANLVMGEMKKIGQYYLQGDLSLG